MFRPWENETVAFVIEPDEDYFKDNEVPENDAHYAHVLSLSEEHEDIKGADLSDDESHDKQLNFQEVFRYVSGRGYPAGLTKNDKANFRRRCKPFSISDAGKLLYKKRARQLDAHGPRSKEEITREVITNEEEQFNLVKACHEGLGSSVQAKALAAHHGRDVTLNLLVQRFYWRGMSSMVRKYCASCLVCQQANPASMKVVPELRPVGIPAKEMQQIGIDICQLPEVDGFRYIVVAIDYYTKWSEAEAITTKDAKTVASFLYRNIICRHGCPRAQINDQGREFVNEIAAELHMLTGTKQRVTSAYHPQANGLVERQNRTIKNKMLKVLEEKTDDWPYIVDGLLFAHRTAKHASTKHSPYFLLYHRHPVVPVDVSRMSSEEFEDVDMEFEGESLLDEHEPFAMDEFGKTLNAMESLRNLLKKDVKKNIAEAQEKQCKHYNRRRASQTGSFKVGEEVWLENMRRKERKGGKVSSMPRAGPYVIVSVNMETSVATLKNPKSGLILKQNSKFHHLTRVVNCEDLLETKNEQKIEEEHLEVIQTENRKKRKFEEPPSFQDKEPNDPANTSRKDDLPRNALLRNGNLSSSIQTDSTTLTVTNTCAFDSIVILIANAYCSVQRYREFVDASKNLLLVAGKSLATVGNTEVTYGCRAEALCSIVDPTLLNIISKERNILSLKYDSWINITDLATRLLSDEPSCIVRRSSSTAHCAFEYEPHCVLETNCKVISIDGIEALSNSVSSYLSVPVDERTQTIPNRMALDQCRHPCPCIPDVEVTGGNHVLLDLGYMGVSLKSLKNSKYRNGRVSLSCVPQVWHFAGVTYVLNGLVAYFSGHYVAYVFKKSRNIWDEFDDLKNEAKEVRSTLQVVPHLLFYVADDAAGAEP